MKQFTPTTAQNDLISSNADINIVALERLQGATTALLLKSLISLSDSLFISNSDACSQYIDLLNKLGYKDYKVIKDTFGNTSIETNTTVTFLKQPKRFLDIVLHWGASHGSIFIDNVDMLFTDREIEQLLLRRKDYQRYTFSCLKQDCRWRNLEYQFGEVAVSERGFPYVNKFSWDRHLINWNHQDLKKSLATKAGVEYYSPFVSFITN